jgi:hypothetical protein
LVELGAAIKVASTTPSFAHQAFESQRGVNDHELQAQPVLFNQMRKSQDIAPVGKPIG